MREYIDFPLDDLPKNLVDKSCSLITKFSTGLIRVSRYKTDPSQIMQLIGSGTLVVIEEEIYGILTAHHVTNLLDERDELGLFISEENKEHNYSIQVGLLDIRDVGIPLSGKTGPDMSFIGLPVSEIPKFRASKSFYPISKQTIYQDIDEDTLKDPFFISGVPDIKTKEVASKTGFSLLKSMRSFVVLPRHQIIILLTNLITSILRWTMILDLIFRKHSVGLVEEVCGEYRSRYSFQRSLRLRIIC